MDRFEINDDILKQGFVIIFENDFCKWNHNMRVATMPDNGDKKARISIYCECDPDLMELNAFLPNRIHVVHGNAWKFVADITEFMEIK